MHVPAGKKKAKMRKTEKTKDERDTQRGRGEKGEGQPAASEVRAVKRAARTGSGQRGVAEGEQGHK